MSSQSEEIGFFPVQNKNDEEYSAEEIDKKLGLSRPHLFLLFPGRSSSVRVSWHFSTECTLLDWIGLYSQEEKDPLGFMDYRGFGVCGPKKGSVDWRIDAGQMDFAKNANAFDDCNNNNISTANSKSNNKMATKSLEFRYFDGLSGAIKAKSPNLLVYNDAQLAINSLNCHGLSAIHPQSNGTQFYAKISCSGSSNRIYRTPLSANGQWNSLNFLFPADRSGELCIRLKAERAWPASGKLVGEANIPLLDLLEATAAGTRENNNRHFSFLLRPQCQQCQLKCHLVPPQRQPFAETMDTLRRGTPSANQPVDFNGNPRALASRQIGAVSASSSSSGGTIHLAPSNPLMAQSICSSFASSSSSSTSSSTSTSNFNAPIKLPPGWEVRIDGRGRIFYMDHINQKTVWTPPKAPLEESRGAKPAAAVDNHLILLGHSDEIGGANGRMARRTVFNGDYTSNPDATTNLDMMNGNVNVHDDNANTSSVPTSPKALQFLLRDDLFGHFMQANQDAFGLYNGSPFLKHIIQRIRKEPTKFGQFERNRELINFVNSFADRTQPLPIGWQMARQSGQQPPLFLDHSNRQITPFDPRLPPERRRPQPNGTAGGCRSAPPIRKKKTTPESMEEEEAADGGRNGRRTGMGMGRRRRRGGQMLRPNGGGGGGGGGIWSWELAEKSDQIQALLAEYSPELAQRVSAKLRLIGQMGELALLRYANDPDLVRAISLLEELEMNGGSPLMHGESHQQPKSQFEGTLAKFHGALEKAGYGKGPSRIRFRLRRDRLMEDAFQKILGANPSQLRKCQMTVNFSEEEGLDYGGPSRELFFLLSRELFHPRHGLFEYASADSHKVQISPMSKFVDNHLRWMELCGRLLGLALVHRCLLDCFFTRPFYKMLAKIPLCLDDLREMDPQLHHSLCWLQQNADATANLELTFCVTQELAGEVTEHELVPNGGNLAVTERNKLEFIKSMLHWRVERGVRPQSDALLRGLNAIVDQELLQMFDADQLELALSGNVQIDIGDWERNTEYRGGYHPNHVVIRWFWLALHEMRNADRLRLLQFVTGSSSVPFEGFKSLRGSNGPKRFCIERWGTEDSLPRAHTCFNRLDLPAYSNKHQLVAKLMLAITESSCYAIE